MAAESAERRQVALSCNAYLKELTFFRQLAWQTPIRSPKIYACVDDGSANAERFVIVMEDLSLHSKVFDQVDDPPDEHFARALALEAAHLHAHYWESDVTQLPWLGRPDGRFVFSLDVFSRAAPANLSAFTRLWRQMFDEDLFERNGFSEAKRLVQLLCGPSCDLIHDGIYAILSSRPKTILHGDMRADNIFSSNTASGELTFIDWQVIHAGPPGPELTQAWMHSLEPDVRRKDLSLLRDYHDKLIELNPSSEAYTYQMLVEDYSLSYCFWLTTLVSVGAATLPIFDQPEAARMKRLWHKMMIRSLTAVTDLSCYSLAASIAEGSR